MNGHGYYVWCAYGALTIGVVCELLNLASRRRKICTRLVREARAKKATLDL